jgi:hypothetical protein
VTKKVWYRATAGSRIEDRGTLTVAGGTIEFVGKKGTVSGRVQSAAIKPVGFNNWVQVKYQDAEGSKDAYFVVSAMLGWSGILGANKQLAEALQAEAGNAA